MKIWPGLPLQLCIAMGVKMSFVDFGKENCLSFGCSIKIWPGLPLQLCIAMGVKMSFIDFCRKYSKCLFPK